MSTFYQHNQKRLTPNLNHTRKFYYTTEFIYF